MFPISLPNRMNDAAARVRSSLVWAAAGLALAACAGAPAGKIDAAARQWRPGLIASERNVIVNRESGAVLENVTLAFRVRVMTGGDSFRLVLSNAYGDAPVDIGAASYRLGETGAFQPVLFGGQPKGVMPAGARLESDPVAAPVADYGDITFRVYLPGKAAMSTIHGAGGSPGEVSPPGDFTRADAFTPVDTLRNRPFFAGVNVHAQTGHRTIVAFGDSITDATGCRIEATPCRWSDVLFLRLKAEGKTGFNVVNTAIAGNQLLKQAAGVAALDRLDRDALDIPGVTHIVLLEGVNDLGDSGPKPDDPARPVIPAARIIAAYEQIIDRAHARGIKVYASPILPFRGAAYFSEEKESVRLEVNRWITGSGRFDAVIRLDEAVADPADPSRLRADLQTGDNLHPSAAGQRAMGEAIPLDLF